MEYNDFWRLMQWHFSERGERLECANFYLTTLHGEESHVLPVSKKEPPSKQISVSLSPIRTKSISHGRLVMIYCLSKNSHERTFGLERAVRPAPKSANESGALERRIYNWNPIVNTGVKYAIEKTPSSRNVIAKSSGDSSLHQQKTAEAVGSLQGLRAYR